MSASSMSHLPAQLSVAEIDAMSQRQIKKHHVAIILLHWFNAIVWLLELSTGVALISSTVAAKRRRAKTKVGNTIRDLKETKTMTGYVGSIEK